MNNRIVVSENLATGMDDRWIRRTLDLFPDAVIVETYSKWCMSCLPASCLSMVRTMRDDLANSTGLFWAGENNRWRMQPRCYGKVHPYRVDTMISRLDAQRTEAIAGVAKLP